MKLLRTLSMGLLATVLVGFSVTAMAADQETKAAEAGALTTAIGVPDADGNIKLLPSGQNKPIAVVLGPDVRLFGTCACCLLPLNFKISDSGKSCTVCACNRTEASCIVDKDLKPSNMQSLFGTLPKGVGIKVVYNTPDKPESGLKTIDVDRKTVLLAVSGIAGQTPDQLVALVKPAGGTKAELVADGTQIVIHLKDEWTTAKLAKFEQALTAAGGKLVDMTTLIKPEATK
jgi:hypothetical protein